MCSKPSYEELKCRVRNLEEKLAESDAFSRRLSYEAVLGRCARALMADTEASVQKGLESLLGASGACRIKYYENVTAPDGSLCLRLAEEACLPGVESQVEDTFFHNVPYSIFPGGISEKLSAGTPVQLTVREPGYDKNDFFHHTGAGSLLVIPVMATGSWLGLVSFESTFPMRVWDSTEEDTLKSAAAMFGAYFEQKNSYEIMRESEEKYRSIIDNIEEGYFELDLKGNLTMFNDAICRIGKISREELMGMNNRDYTTPETAKEMCRLYNRIYETGEPSFIKNYEVFNNNGDKLSLEISTTLMKDKNGRPVGFRGVARDMTSRIHADKERKELEWQLQHAQRLEAIGTLAGGIAHDFNNLMMGIQGNVSIIQARGIANDWLAEKLKSIERCVESGANLTQQLLGFARGGQICVKPLDINKEIESSSMMFGRTRKEINIVTDFQEDVWPVEGDKGQVEQVLLNLYVNAWQAMPEGGSLRISTRNVMLDDMKVKPFGLNPGRYVMISLADEGVGMDNSIRQHIFEPFFTTKEMGRGTGLGLASAFGIVKNHKGYITVDSEPGKGSDFRIFLPASDRNVEMSRANMMRKASGGETILIVDDEDIIRDVGSSILEELGYNVLTAESGRKAVEVYREKSGDVDLVVLDMIMPDMNGKTTFQQLKGIDPDVKVLLSSGYSVSSHAEEVMESGACGFIQKPYNLTRLSLKLEEVLR